MEADLVRIYRIENTPSQWSWLSFVKPSVVSLFATSMGIRRPTGFEGPLGSSKGKGS
jgi:hypothetical protein